MDIQKLSTKLNGNDFVTVNIKDSILPATGYTWSDYVDGTLSCAANDVIRLQPTVTVDGEILNVNSDSNLLDKPFQLYNALEPVKTDGLGDPIIGWECTTSTYFAYIMYLPTGQYDQPRNEDHADPNGHYSLFEECY